MQHWSKLHSRLTHKTTLNATAAKKNYPHNPAEMQKQITKYFYRLSADDDIADATTEIGDDDEVGLEVSESTRKILDSVIGERS